MNYRDNADLALRQLELEEERRKEAVRTFYQREARENQIPSGWRWFLAFCGLALGVILVYWFVIAPAIAALTGQP